MAISITPGYRAAGVGVAAAALLIGAFSLGMAHGGSLARRREIPGHPHRRAQHAGRITVTGNGTVTGVPNQLSLSSRPGQQLLGQLRAGQANQTTRRRRAALTSSGSRGARHPDLGPEHLAELQDNSQIPTSYAVSESLTATLNQPQVRRAPRSTRPSGQGATRSASTTCR